MNRIATIALLTLFAGALRAAETAVSPAFRFDARYAASGVTPELWAAYEASGLSSLFALRTRRLIVDTDGDGMPDIYELAHGLDPARNDADEDGDSDGRTNMEEFNAGTNPSVADDWSKSASATESFVLSTWMERPAIHEEDVVEVWARSLAFLVNTAGRAKDTDRDGLPDFWEVFYGLDPFVADAGLDSDGDGRTNREEYNAGTSPIAADDWTKSADDSGAFRADTRVIYIGGLPIVSNTFAVVRVSNLFVCDTGGLYYDWDGDGIPNWWEARFSRGGSKTALDAGSDVDGDGMTALDEFVAYTIPTNSASVFSISIGANGAQNTQDPPRRQKSPAALNANAAASGGGLAISWPTARGRVYKLYASESLTDGWAKEPIAVVEGTGEVVSVPVGQESTVRFFRVTVDLLPAK